LLAQRLQQEQMHSPHVVAALMQLSNGQIIQVQASTIRRFG
jgi:hypothetical protein